MNGRWQINTHQHSAPNTYKYVADLQLSDFSSATKPLMIIMEYLKTLNCASRTVFQAKGRNCAMIAALTEAKKAHKAGRAANLHA